MSIMNMMLFFGVKDPAAGITVTTPKVTSPKEAATGVSTSATMTTSNFSVTKGVDTHTSSDWELATDAAFTNIVKSNYRDMVNKTTWNP